MGLKVLSLFDGKSGCQLALQRAGIEVDKYFACEIDKNSIKVTQNNFPNTIQLGDVRNVMYEEGIIYSDNGKFEVGDIDLLAGGSPCFPSGQKIITSEGFKNIEDITKGEMVLTHKGRYREVVTPMKRKYSGLLYEIRPTYYNFTIKTTNEHPFYTQRGWVKAEDLKVDDYLSMPINKESIIPEQIQYVQHINQHVKKEKTTLLPILDENFWKLIGYWLGEGWTRDKRNGLNSRPTYRIYLASTESKLNFIKPVLESLDIHYRIEKGLSCDKITFGSKDYWLYIKQFTHGSRASDKFIPEFVQNMPKNLIDAFIEGYKNGDGSENEEKISYSSTSKELLEGLQRLLLKSENKLYSLSQSSNGGKSLIEGREVNTKSCYSLGKRKNTNRFAYFTEDYVFYKIREINKKTVVELPVYNFEVKEDNSYCLPITTVHNCQNLSRTVINKVLHNQGLQGEKSKLFYDYLRILKQVNPRYLLLENVESMKNEDKEIITECVQVEPIMINSSLVSAQDRKRYYWTNIKVDDLPEDKGLLLKDIVLPANEVPDKYWYDRPFTYNGSDKKVEATMNFGNFEMMNRVYNLNSKSPTLTTMSGGNNQKKVFQDGRCRKLMPIEYERLQTIDDNYTEGVADTHRYNMLGNGWTIDVIAHIFKGLK